MTVSSASITSLSATETASLVRQRELSPVEVVKAHLQRIEELNPEINAFAYVNSEGALAEARRAELALMFERTMGREAAGSLTGVPITIKSCIDVQGFPCEAGSRLRQGYIAPEDAPLVKRLRNAGAIVLGNTNVPEMLVAYHTENEIYGRTNNPFNLSRSPGGSSGGEAAAIASGMSAGGIGSDGGGSIRVPAHFSGICGLKPTPGRIPATGHYPPCGGPFSLIGVVGPMARTVNDLRLFFETIAGYDPGDPVSVPASLYKGCAKHPRIGFYEDDGYSTPTPETQAAVRTAAKMLQDTGLEVEPFRPQGLERARELWSVIFVDAIGMVLKPMVEGHENELSSNTREFLAVTAEQPPLTGERLLSTLLERDQLRSQVLSQMEQFPILLAPVCSIPAFQHEHAGWGSEHPADYLRTMSYCQHYNLLGNPAAVVPVGKSPEGLPIGIQIIGRPFEDERVLEVAALLEKQVGWQHLSL
jgi:Asp-tRNA(Asn)/Glu-tRNA(Gln) amidotransferase A subunit family amidase